MGRQTEVELRLHVLGDGRALEAGHGLFQHLQIQVEPHPAHMAGLHLAQDVARTAQAQVFHGHLETGTQIVHVHDDAQPLLGHFAFRCSVSGTTKKA